MALLQWHMVYKLGEDEVHRAPMVALRSPTKWTPTRESHVGLADIRVPGYPFQLYHTTLFICFQLRLLGYWDVMSQSVKFKKNIKVVLHGSPTMSRYLWSWSKPGFIWIGHIYRAILRAFGAKVSLLACHNLNINAMEKITVEDHLKGFRFFGL